MKKPLTITDWLVLKTEQCQIREIISMAHECKDIKELMAKLEDLLETKK